MPFLYNTIESGVEPGKASMTPHHFDAGPFAIGLSLYLAELKLDDEHYYAQCGIKAEQR